MKCNLEKLKIKVLNGGKISKSQALFLVSAPLDKLCEYANEIREKFCSTSFDICSVFNGKCGKCSEDCKFCAQSSFYNTKIDVFDMIDDANLPLNASKYNYSKGIARFSIVTSGRGLSQKDTKIVAKNYQFIKQNCNISLCASHGLLTKNQLITLKNSGVKRIHCNLEASKKFFKSICTTHTYNSRVKVIKLAKRLNLEVCSGGVFGVGESWSNRIELAFALKKLKIISVPINALKAISGTPLENQKPLSSEEIRRIIAIFRFILPKSVIRMGAGRGNFTDKGASFFASGANGCISGDMLTTSSVCIDDDLQIIKKLGFNPVILEEK